MNDRVRITVGLVAFLGLVTFPLWQPLFARGDIRRPELELPRDGSSCVEDTSYMRPYHVDLLNRWRNAVVREGEVYYTSSSGDSHLMSLTGTCMDCHADRETFCTRCHDYANVAPICWDCHIEPEVDSPDG